MSKIALKSFSVEDLLTSLKFKRDLLFFDKIQIDSGNFNMVKSICEILLYKTNSNINPLAKGAFEHNLNEIEYLVKTGYLEVLNLTNKIEVVVNTMDTKNLELVEGNLSEIQYYMHLISNMNNSSTIERTQEMILGLKKLSDYTLRLYNMQEVSKNNINLYPILILPEEIYSNEKVSKNNAVQVILRKIPIPDDKTSWEEISSFKSNEIIRAKYYLLIEWINKISKENIIFDEFEDRLNYLFNDYVSSLKMEKLKYNTSTLQVVISGTAIVLENLVKLRFSHISDSLFKFTSRKTNLLDSESKLKNRELAYIYETNEKFG